MLNLVKNLLLEKVILSLSKFLSAMVTFSMQGWIWFGKLYSIQPLYNSEAWFCEWHYEIFEWCLFIVDEMKYLGVSGKNTGTVNIYFR